MHQKEASASEIDGLRKAEAALTSADYSFLATASKLPQQEGILWNISKQINDKKKDLELSISDSKVAIEEVEGSIAKLQEEAMPGGRDKDTWQSCFWSNWKKKKSLDQTNDRKKGPEAVYLRF